MYVAVANKESVKENDTYPSDEDSKVYYVGSDVEGLGVNKQYEFCVSWGRRAPWPTPVSISVVFLVLHPNEIKTTLQLWKILSMTYLPRRRRDRRSQTTLDKSALSKRVQTRSETTKGNSTNILRRCKSLIQPEDNGTRKKKQDGRTKHLSNKQAHERNNCWQRTNNKQASKGGLQVKSGKKLCINSHPMSTTISRKFWHRSDRAHNSKQY